MKNRDYPDHSFTKIGQKLYKSPGDQSGKNLRVLVIVDFEIQKKRLIRSLKIFILNKEK